MPAFIKFKVVFANIDEYLSIFLVTTAKNVWINSKNLSVIMFMPSMWRMISIPQFACFFKKTYDMYASCCSIHEKNVSRNKYLKA